jgi:hypothetical protein
VVAEEALHDAVLQRVEADDDEPATHGQRSPGGGEGRLEFVELAVDVDADGLEAAGGGVAAGLAPDDARDDAGSWVVVRMGRPPGR